MPSKDPTVHSSHGHEQHGEEVMKHFEAQLKQFVGVFYGFREPKTIIQGNTISFTVTRGFSDDLFRKEACIVSF